MRLIVLAGQSNMSGRGIAEPGDLTPVDRVKVFAPDRSWREAIEPVTKDRPFIGTFAADGTKRVSPDPWDNILPAPGDKVVGVGPGRTFAKLLAAFLPGEEIGLVPTSVGGTPIAAWLPGGVDEFDPSNHPYDDAVARVRDATKHGEVAAILWHQGEGDSARRTPDYKAKLRAVIENFRRDLSLPETVPFIMGTLASFYEGATRLGVEAVDRAMVELAAELPFAAVASTKDLDHRGDHLHFSGAAQHILGERYFRVWKSLAALTPAKIEAQAAKYTGAPRFRTPVLLDPGEFLVTSPFGERTHPVTGEPATFHAGIDGALWNGRMLLETGVCAWNDGVVAEAAETEGPAGTNVAIDHGGGLVSRYFHLEAGSLKVAAGDRVRRGAELGWMGKTGRATGEHLHFQIEKDGTAIDPMPLLLADENGISAP